MKNSDSHHNSSDNDNEREKKDEMMLKLSLDSHISKSPQIFPTKDLMARFDALNDRRDKAANVVYPSPDRSGGGLDVVE
ncbi:hypothetical protein LINPERHAP2_LOCUS40231 [Linum perenne]